MNRPDFTHEKRACSRFLANLGIETKEGLHYSSADVIARTYASDTERYEVWYAEALLHGLVAMERGDHKIALRCWGQVREYAGKLGREVFHDAALTLRNALEALTDQLCACHRGSTCDVIHDPASCTCSQCTAAERGAA